MPVQRLKVAILPLDLPCSGPVTLSGEIITTGRSHVYYHIDKNVAITCIKRAPSRDLDEIFVMNGKF